MTTTVAAVGVMVWAALAGGTQPYETYESVVARDGPVAQFRFGDSAGSGTITDSTGSFTAINHGIALGGEGPFPGSRSGAFGGEAYASLPSDPLLEVGAFTVEAWVYWSGGSPYGQPIFELGSSSSNYMYLTPSSTASKHPLLFEIHAGSGSVTVQGKKALPTGAWEYVAISETSAGTLTLYLNGAVNGTPVEHAALSPASLGSSVPDDYLGRSISGEPFFKGSMSNVAFYQKALTEKQIEEHYDDGEFPVSTEAPVIHGSPTEGSVLTASEGAWTGLAPIKFAFKWESCSPEKCESIAKATKSEYTVGAEEVGQTLRVAVTASNSAGEHGATSAPTTTVEGKPFNTALPVISGEADVGQLLTVSNGGWRAFPSATYSYQWQACKGKACVAVENATSPSYRVTSAELGKALRAVVTASNSFGEPTATSAATAKVKAGVPVNVEAPAISGNPKVGEILTASRGSWAGTEPITYTYQWQHCEANGSRCEGIPGATAASYKVEPNYGSYALDVVVTATNSVGKVNAASASITLIPSNTAPPAISGTTQEGQTVTASTGSWAGTSPLTYGYQWQSCNERGESCQNVEGAADPSYRLGPGDVGNTLRVIVTASNGSGFASASSAATAVISTTITAPLSLAPPEISGTADAGRTLSASTGTWTGGPPISYTYQWESCNSAGESCANVASPGPTYRLGPGDVGNTLRVLVTATNAAGDASRISAASAVVAGPSSGSESPCTDIWVGASEGSWQEGGNWSAGTAPGPTDVACVGSETTVRVSEGSDRVGVLDDAGELVISGGSLELENASEASTVSALALSGRGAALTGAGSLHVSGDFTWGKSAAMSGSGKTVIEPGVAGKIEASSGCQAMSLSGGRTLVNEGTLTFGWGTLLMSEGARLENRGVFADNSEASCYPTQIQPEGSGAAPLLLNAGTFEKTGGTGTSTVAVEFSNNGTVSALSGTLKFIGGGVSEQAATGAWTVEGGGSIVLGGGTFLIGEAVNLSAVSVEGATVTRVSAVPVNTAPPSIVGVAEDGHTLSASAGTWSGAEPISLSYEWQRCNSGGGECKNIAQAKGQNYTLGAGDVGTTVRVLVTASNSYGETTVPSLSSAVVAPPPPPANTAPPQITGTAQDGSVLAASTGSWNAVDPVSYTYKWESCDPAGEDCVPVEYATESQYELGEGDIGSTLRVLVTATNAGGSTQATSPPSPGIQTEPVSELEAPSISGTPNEHQVLYADPGRWGGTETQFSYQWESCSERGTECAPIEGATGTEYDLAEGDLATTLRVRVGASNARDSLTDVSPVTSVIGAPGTLADVTAPSISGAPQAGQALTASPGSWSGTGAISYAYQCQSCNRFGLGCGNISGASASSYTLAANEAGSTVRVLVSAVDELGHRAAQASQITPPIATTQAPVIEQPPRISGVALDGHTLTTGAGVFSGEAPISYSYQWERCTQPGNCTAIEGATHSSYTLSEGDVGSTLVVVVNATDPAGGTTAVSSPTADVGPEAVLEVSSPSISGVVQLEGTLTANPGIWSASGPVSYAYQWESCNQGGEDCAPIAGASEQSYLLGTGDLGSTLRVNVTASGSTGSKNAVSAHTAAVSGGEVSVADAEKVAEQTDPDLLAPSTTATLEGQSVTPALSDMGGELDAQSTLTGSTLSKEAPAELAVNTPAGELSLAPAEPLPSATRLPTVVNGAAALFANTWPSTDTIERPSPLGATAILQVRSAEAPRSFSWHVHLGPDQELKQLANGSVAVVETSQETTEPSGAPGPSEAPQLDTTTEGAPESSEEKQEAEHAESEANKEEEAPLETLPAAPTSSTPPAEATVGQPQLQQTQVSYESAKSEMKYAEEQTSGKALMVIGGPTVTGAEGGAVPASLAVASDTLTVTIKPHTGTSYPLLGEIPLAAPTNKESTERDPVKYGISDPEPQEPGHIDEHFNESGKAVPKFDPNLYDGPPYTTRHMRTARLIVPYDVLVTPSTPYRTTERHVLETWLRKAKGEGLEPYITIGQDYSVDPCRGAKAPKAERACPLPSIGQYKKAVTKLMQEVIRWHSRNGWPLVKLWGAWNEPDAANDPLHKDEPRAAQFWEVARATLQDIVPHFPCSGCTVVAGEFSTYYPVYTSCYRNMILYSYCHGPHNRYTRYWFGEPRDPEAWGFHDYADVEHRDDTVAQHFATFARERLDKPRLFMSEAGVELQDGQESETELGELEAKSETEQAAKRELQLQAAEEFLNLPHGLSYPIDRMYYYEYTAPTIAEQEAHKFDSALIEEENGERRERPAYCVLAYEDHRCPPLTVTGPNVGVDVEGYTERTVKVSGTVNPEGLPAEYRFEYGSTPSLGGKTPLEKVKAGLSADEVSAEFALTVSSEECFDGADVGYFRIEATNATGTRDGSVSRLVPACPE